MEIYDKVAIEVNKWCDEKEKIKAPYSWFIKVVVSTEDRNELIKNIVEAINKK